MVGLGTSRRTLNFETNQQLSNRQGADKAAADEDSDEVATSFYFDVKLKQCF